MKTIIKLIIAGILCLADLSASSNTKSKDPYHLIVEGKFLAQKNIRYTVYKMDSRGTFVSESHNKGKKYYSVMCDVGCKYLIRFQDKVGNVKFLMIDVTKNGYFTIDVDFSRSYDAQLKFTKIGYAVIPLTNNPIAKN